MSHAFKYIDANLPALLAVHHKAQAKHKRYLALGFYRAFVFRKLKKGNSSCK